MPSIAVYDVNTIKTRVRPTYPPMPGSASVTRSDNEVKSQQIRNCLFFSHFLQQYFSCDFTLLYGT
jgi:hypothetical protein